MNNNNIIAPMFVYLLIDEHERRNFMRIHRRRLRDASNPFEMADTEFQSNFRLYKELARDFIEWLNPHAPIPIRNTCIPFHLKVLATLNFLAKGSYQHAVGVSELLNLSQPSISRSISAVCKLIVNALMPEWITFPTEPEEKATTKLGFYEKTGFRGVIGCIDGTHIDIITPPITDEDHPPHVYINRKGNHSINVMMICDSRNRILACDARYPGSVHDSAIWRVQEIRNYLREQFENGDKKTILIGDSGYGLEPWLFTPFAVAVDGTPEARFNQLLRSTRVVIEQTFGILKGRWRALLKHRVLHYHPADAAYIIYSAVILHNICIRANIQINEHEVVNEGPDHNQDFGGQNNQLIDGDNHLLRVAQAARQHYIMTNIINN